MTALPAPVPAPPRRALGIVAFIASTGSIVLGAVGIWAAGFALGRVLRFTDYPDLIQETEAQLWDSLGRAGIALAILVVAWLVHAAVATWGLVQGIVATALGRGRPWGIAAIAIACTGWILLVSFMQEALLSGLLGIIPFVG